MAARGYIGDIPCSINGTSFRITHYAECRLALNSFGVSGGGGGKGIPLPGGGLPPKGTASPSSGDCSFSLKALVCLRFTVNSFVFAVGCLEYAFYVPSVYVLSLLFHYAGRTQPISTAAQTTTLNTPILN